MLASFNEKYWRSLDQYNIILDIKEEFGRSKQAQKTHNCLWVTDGRCLYYSRIFMRFDSCHYRTGNYTSEVQQPWSYPEIDNSVEVTVEERKK
ncbi:hypothetical protein HNY73_009308 [Argiope bruennichi]|uniref:Uncharacterized protein n=1 Tax=Argiope bruennichi TaxID=94029 RepID=A0A8T0FEN0_ARGBR|nr:hypothetical protein HNY73_009308 [Argiope bruennichi]